MERSLLRTRLTIPPPPRRLIRRDRLLDALEREVPAHRLTLVSAPAGYGKTTLVAEWARESQIPVAWLTADLADAAPEMFLRYLFAAWAKVQPALETALPGILLSGQTPVVDEVLAGLVNFASEHEVEIAVVIDDCDVITSPPILDALAWLLDHLPPTVHLVLTGRAEPALPLARYRARQAAIDIDAADLRLTSDECREMLSGIAGTKLNDGDIDRLNERLEGWAAGVQLVSLGLREDTGAVPHVTVTGRQRFIADFLRGEVLDGVEPELRRFLVTTSIVDRIDASLAAALTRDANAQQTLERLERMNLFVMPLDDSREWFRYHRLFADVLGAELERESPGEVAGLHERAALWYLTHDMGDQAFDHAIATGDVDLVVQVVERFALLKLFSGQVRALLGWMQVLPEPWLEAKAELRLVQIVVMMYSGSFETAIRALEELDQRVRGLGDEARGIVGRVTAVKCFVACEMNDVSRAEGLAAAALDTLAPEDHIFRGGVWGALGDVYRRNSRWLDAQKHYLRALPYADTPAGIVQSVGANGALADLELRRGNLRSAAHYWRRALGTINDPAFWGTQPLPLIGWVYIRHGEILYEWNDLEAARDALETGRERVRAGGDPRSIIASGLLATRLHVARGELDAADDELERLRAVSADAQFPEWRAEVERCQVELWLAQGRLRGAVTWTDEALARDATALPDQEPVTLAVARVLITKGDTSASGQALRLLDPVIERAASEGRAGLRIAALALRALALAGRGDSAGALATLEPALRLGEPQGYARTFLDLGLPMARLLQEAASRGVMPDYVGCLLAGFGETPLLPGGADTRLPEPLSERELEVLRSVAAGLTNREIADALFISPETVKKHTGSIYGKLGVRGRTQAVARARDLSLLG